MNNISLSAMGVQYDAEADNLEKMIAACKERRRFAIAGGDSKEAARLERLAELHAQQRADLLRLSVHLRHYYGNAKTEEGGATYGE